MTDSTPPEWAAEAAASIRRMPMRRRDGDTGRPAALVRESGYFLGVDECARTVAADADRDLWLGFGRRWPVLSKAGWLVAPAVPVPVGRGPTEGPDGVYRQSADRILREAVGVERGLLSAGSPADAESRVFDLLWFGDRERLMLSGDSIEIEDLFCRAVVPASPAALDRLLVRGRRLAPELVAGLPKATGRRTSEIAVGRQLALMAPGRRWRRPEDYLGGRSDVRAVRPGAGSLAAELRDGRVLEFASSTGPDGWMLELRNGDSAITRIRLRTDAVRLELSAEVAGTTDLLAPAARGRLAFDLHADLIALAGQKV